MLHMDLEIWALLTPIVVTKLPPPPLIIFTFCHKRIGMYLVNYWTLNISVEDCWLNIVELWSIIWRRKWREKRENEQKMTNSNQPLYSGHNSVPVCFLVFSIVFHFAIVSQMFCDFFSKSLPTWLKDFDL